MNDSPRLIEHAFPLKQASLDSVHEKNVRHGHLSTLHIWPARRPLAACRAALIATLLPDPGTPEERRKLVERIGGTVVKRIEKKKIGGKTIEVEREETVGGVLHWGRESSPDMDWFRQEIRKAYGGRAPKVLDPFAGGGAIPLEAMRLGCEITAVDINPVAWFILKCTLEYPQKLGGQKRPLPSFVVKNREFMEPFLKAQGLKATALRTQLDRLGMGQIGEDRPLDGLDLPPAILEADLAWHVRAWGWWVLQRAKGDLGRFYPTIDGKPTVAYLWARTVRCKSCRATIPLLKTRWLCRKDKKRVLLTMEPNAERTEVVFGVQTAVPVSGGNAAQRRENDKRLGAGTMTSAGARCPCCAVVLRREDLRLDGQEGKLAAVMTAVVVDGANGKEYRSPSAEEVVAAEATRPLLERVSESLPHGLPGEPIPSGASRAGGGTSFPVRLYGFRRWQELFIARQLLSIASIVTHIRAARAAVSTSLEWDRAVVSYLAAALDSVVNRNSALCTWTITRETTRGTFARFALPMTWDFAEAAPLASGSGGFAGAVEWVARYIESAEHATQTAPQPDVMLASATVSLPESADFILTDPPYYDAINYADLMDYFYVWLRRTLQGLSPESDRAFDSPLSPKWDHETADGELIDDSSRFAGDREKSKAAYEDGMSRAFKACRESLRPDGRLVVVFAHKQPDAWETLVSAIIRAGFVVDGSWPIQTEMANRTRALSSAALSSSVWLVCKKRSEAALPGWDSTVLEAMRERIGARLRDFWDAGIRGPDFVWAATGPALEAYSKHPVVKKANEAGKVMEVPEFLRQVRRIVVDFVVGRVLSHNGDAEMAASLDDVTTYYLLHRNDFGLKDASIGASILYAVSCNLSDRELADQYDILVRTGGQPSSEEGADEESAEEDDEVEEGTGSVVRLKGWQQRSRPNLGYEASSGRTVPLIDQVHRLMHLWKGGEVTKVDDYLDARGLRRNELFRRLLQALLELADGDERATLESISNHIGARGPMAERPLFDSAN